MSWIALKMLVGDRAKFFGIVLGLTFAALLITQQGSIFCGLMLPDRGPDHRHHRGRPLGDGPQRPVRRRRQADDREQPLPRPGGRRGQLGRPALQGERPGQAELPPRRPEGEDVSGRRELERDRTGESTSAAVERVHQGPRPGRSRASTTPPRPPARWYDPQIGQRDRAGDPDRPRRRLDGRRAGRRPMRRSQGSMWVGKLEDLRRPEAIVVDRVGLRKLFPGCQLDEPFADRPRPTRPTSSGFAVRRVGRELEMNDHRAIIVGVCEATRTFQSNPVVYTIYSRAKQFVPRSGRSSRTSWPRRPRTRTARRCPRGRRRADPAADRPGRGTSEKLHVEDDQVLLEVHGHPDQLRDHGFLGFLVGTAIAGQTFYNFTLENLKQFGALKAMGAPTCGSSG